MLAELEQSCLGMATIVRNLNMEKRRPWSPMRVCRERAGPGESSQKSRPMTRIGSARTARPTTLPAMSRRRLVATPQASGARVLALLEEVIELCVPHELMS